jgi:hypothetical protein
VRREQLVDRRGASIAGCYRFCPLTGALFDAPDEIRDYVHPIHIVVRDFHAHELVFDSDHQFNAIEPVGSEIVGEVRVIRDTFDRHPQMLGNERTDLA